MIVDCLWPIQRRFSLQNHSKENKRTRKENKNDNDDDDDDGDDDKRHVWR